MGCTGKGTVIRVLLAGVGDGRPARLLCCCDGVLEKRSVWQWLRLLVWCCFYESNWTYFRILKEGSIIVSDHDLGEASFVMLSRSRHPTGHFPHLDFGRHTWRTVLGYKSGYEPCEQRFVMLSRSQPWFGRFSRLYFGRHTWRTVLGYRSGYELCKQRFVMLSSCH